MTDRQNCPYDEGTTEPAHERDSVVAECVLAERMHAMQTANVIGNRSDGSRFLTQPRVFTVQESVGGKSKREGWGT